MPEATLTVARRFCGPPDSGNGGWVSGAMGALLGPDPLGGPIEVSLRRPPPLDRPLPLTYADGTLRLLDDRAEGAVVAEARAADHDPEPVPTVPIDVAREAEARYPGLTRHPFPTCYACGTGREDGLRVFPGQVEAATPGRDRVAATWTPAAPAPGADLWPEAWAALDCPGGWAGDMEERLMVLGRMTARLHALPQAGETHVVVGEARGAEGRKTWTATSLYSAAGDLLGAAEHLWITIDPATFGGTPA